MTVILTDCDGVLLNWEYAFNIWIERKGFKRVEGHEFIYDIGERYGMDKGSMKGLVKDFNESAMIGFLPPLRDAVEYVQKLHREHGYVFHVITSLSLDTSACRLRTQNLQKLFGETVFADFIYLDTGADKDEALSMYYGKDYYWIEDKPANALSGKRFGLQSVLIEHGHNMNNKEFPVVKNWKQLYRLITGD